MKWIEDDRFAYVPDDLYKPPPTPACVTELYRKLAKPLVQPWRDQAACLDTDEGLWFDPDREAEAKAICAGCSVRVECLDDALTEEDSECIRGGLNDSERVKVYLHRKRHGVPFKADIDRALASASS